ncbi:Uncharacterised protein [Bacteroides xylanisolvens]|nr:Uncharacterised protein [Bacteroides xylanisolvens]
MIETEAVNAGIGIYSFFNVRLATGAARPLESLS